MAYHRCQISKSKIQAIFSAFLTYAFCLTCVEKMKAVHFHETLSGRLFHHFSCSVTISNVSETIVTGQNVFLESESKAAQWVYFVTLFYKTIHFNQVQTDHQIVLMHRGVANSVPSYFCSSRIFNKCSSTKMKAASFQQISMILRVIIDGH